LKQKEKMVKFMMRFRMKFHRMRTGRGEEPWSSSRRPAGEML
jgi:hypothetical protein